MPEKGESRSKPTIEAVIVGAVFCLLGIATVVYGARDWAPALASRHGAGIDAMLKFLLLTTGSMFLAGHLVLGFFIWRGSRQNRVTLRLASPKTERIVSVVLGTLMTLVAEGGVLAIGLPVWGEYFAAGAPPDAVVVEVTGSQFAWNVRYPGEDRIFGSSEPGLVDDVTNPLGVDRSDPAAADDIVLINQIYVPVDRPVRVLLRSRGVIHSFFLPHFRVKQDAIPGMTPEVVFVPTKEGTYEIACTELCGLGHYRMRGLFHVVSKSGFERWLEEQTIGS